MPVQFIFAVKKRNALIEDAWRESLHKYLTGIVQNNGHKIYEVNSVTDHVHLFAGMRPDQSCSELMKRVKGGSSLWINENNYCRGEFSWQSGFGAFAYGKSQVKDVVKYILNQPEHHKKETFLDEYKKFLRAFEIEFDDRYIFHEPV